jgi:hypothetical protein
MNDRRTTGLVAVTVLVLVGAAAAADRNPQAAPPKPPERPPQQFDEVIDKLSKPVDITKAIDSGTLKDVLDFLADKYDMTVVVDTVAFKNDLNIDDIEGQQVKLPRMLGARLDVVFRLLLGQVRGAVLVRDGYVEIVPTARVVAELGQKNLTEDQLSQALIGRLPLIHLAAKQKPLEELLRDVGRAAGRTVALSPQAGEKAKAPLTVTLVNLPAESAVRVLADMADLDVVASGSALYVTTKERAADWRAADEKTRRPEPDKARPDPVKPPAKQ